VARVAEIRPLYPCLSAACAGRNLLPHATARRRICRS
jgi:hypothetical protein